MAPETAREARSRAGGGEVPAVLVMELRPLAEMIPRTAPVAVVDGSNFLELAARLLPL